MNSERYEELMVKVVDETATPAEKEELMSYIADKPELRRELESHRALHAVAGGWAARLEADLLEAKTRAEPVARVERVLGVALFLIGYLLLCGWGLVEVVLASDVPLAIRAGTAAFGAGTLILLIHVVRTRLRHRKSDPYEKVIR